MARPISHDAGTFTFRLSTELKRGLAERARRNERSPAGELRYVLGRYLETTVRDRVEDTGTKRR